MDDRIDMEALSILISNLEGISKSSYLMDQIISELRETLIRKGEDYGDAFVWQNPQTAASLVNIPLETAMRYLVAHKIGRILHLTSSEKEPNFETEYDTWKDLLGYILLMLGYLKYIELEELR